MDFADFAWGALVIGAGIFIAVYGSLLFKFALAAMGFGVGFVGAWWLLDSQSDTTRLLIAMAVGGVAAVLLFSLVRFGVYIAGAILGLVVALLVGGIIDVIGSAPNDFVMTILVLGGLGGGGFFGPRLGNMLIALATSAAGAYLIMDGVQIWYASRIGGDLADPVQTLAQRLSITIFAIICLISFLGQNNARKLRHRVLN
jgi:hypothetical protein